MPKTDRHSIKVTVGCQGNKCLQSHKAVEEVVLAWWWALKGLFIKKFNKNCSYGEVFAARLVFGFLRPTKPCLSLANQTWLLSSVEVYAIFFICHRKLRVMSRPPWLFFTLSSYGQGSVALAHARYFCDRIWPESCSSITLGWSYVRCWLDNIHLLPWACGKLLQLTRGSATFGGKQNRSHMICKLQF